MAKFRVTTIRTTTAFFVNGNGIRKYCDTAIKTLGSNGVELVTSIKNGAESSWRLQSTDGFNYKGTIMVGEHTRSLSLRLFMQDNSVLLYGGWERQGANGEMVIEGQLCGLIFSQDPHDKRDLLPAA